MIMKKIGFSLFIAALFLLHHTASRSQPVSSRIQAVTLFQKGAQIERTATFRTNGGLQELVIGDLPPDIEQESLQVEGKGVFAILGTHFRENYLEKPREKARILQLRDSLEALERQKGNISNLQKVYEHEREILLANKHIGGERGGVPIEALQAAMGYFRDKLTDIGKAELEMRQEERQLSEQMERIQKQLDNYTGRARDRVGEAYVQIQSDRPVSGEIRLSYLVMQAGWQPGYDLRIIDISQPVQLVYHARIQQNTGEDWDQIPLTLSTGRANVSNRQPKLHPRYIGFIQERPTPVPHPPKTQAPSVLREQMNVKEVSASEDRAADVAVSSVKNRQIHTEYRPENPRLITGNGEEHTIRLLSDTLKSKYTYYTAPALDRDAFLLARIGQWSSNRLLPARASLFFENKYVGESFLNPSQTEDTIEVSLGRDPAIVVERTPVETFQTEQLLGRNKTITFQWAITCRNTKQQPIDLVIMDQLPVSTHEDIKVTPIELSKADYQGKTGFLTWETRLQAGQKEDKTVRFSIRYPSDKQINY